MLHPAFPVNFVLTYQLVSSPFFPLFPVSEFIHELPSVVATSSLAAAFIHIVMTSDRSVDGPQEKSLDTTALLCQVVDKLHEVTAVPRVSSMKGIEEKIKGHETFASILTLKLFALNRNKC